MNSWISLLVTGFLVSVAHQSAMAANTSVDSFRQLATAWWEETIRDNPLLATASGDHRWNDRLPTVSLQESQRQAHRMQEYRDRLSAIDVAQLDRTEQTNFDIIRRSIENSLAEFQWDAYLIPITNREGFHISFPELRRDMPLRTVGDFQNYIARLQQFDRYAAGHIELMREGLRRGWTLPLVVLQRYREPIEAHIVSEPHTSLFYEPFRHMPSTISTDEQARLRDAGAVAIRDGIVTGYRRFLEFMTNEYVPAARDSIGAAALPNGRAFYRHRVRHFTTLDITPEEVHRIGLSEVERIEQEMKGVMQRVGYTGSIRQFVQDLRANPELHCRSAEELLRAAARILKRIDGELPRLFRTLPRTPYGLQPVPDYIAPQTTAAYYMQPAGDGTRAGFYFLNTYDLASRPLYNLMALSLHEAVPGHHLQLALQQELGELPPYRRFSDTTAFVEGWALYAERLGLELGLYDDPHVDFGRLTFEMWRACRLVVDTGMHYLGWTREQSIEFLADRTALSLHDIRAEVDHYIAWPGQALAYKMGELKFRALRKKAEERLGSQFDVREFHDTVLQQGAVPLPILEQYVDAWLDRK